MDYPDIYYLHALNLLPQLGPKRLGILANTFDTFKDAYFANTKTLLFAGLEKHIVDLIARHRTTVHVESEAAKLENEQIQLLSFRDTLYPELLLETPQFPPLLYYRGTLQAHDELMVAVVGTRKISTYGRTVTPEFVYGLGSKGVTVVSGLALGVDSLAHQTCVDNNFRTVAVIGSGLDAKSIYPRQHQYLAEQIIEAGGLLLSEYPIGAQAFKQNFIARNRIISGMSKGTLVVEANGKSGALITARHALDQDRSVYAVPGAIYSPGSEGPHNLIRMGAQLVTKPEHILEDLHVDASSETIVFSISDFTPDQQIILNKLSREPMSADEIVQSVDLDASKVTAALTLLEMKGAVKNLGAQQYIISQTIK